ncbi:hypothetical protein KGY77_01670 [Candidatus Bipolaricaulota bacterium]|nr:hypothetical protein [Candidatus Bipolaricaulota bacterium]
MSTDQVLSTTLSKGNGIFRLAPNWVPRPFSRPGRRLKLATEDLYALGKSRGGITERWFASTTHADNVGAPPDEGMSYIVVESDGNPEQVLLKEAIEVMGDEILGEDVMEEYGGWKMFSKFFDNMGPLPHHVHLDQEHAEKVGAESKPEGYYFPEQMNFTRGDFPYTFFGLKPDTTKDEVIKCLERFDKGDNGILDLSQAYRLKPGTGWYVPEGLLHAPGSLCTYEPQYASDVFSMFQSIVQGETIPREMLVKDVPEGRKNDLDYLVDLLDWEANVDPNLTENRYNEPVPVKPLEEMKQEGYIENWVVYGSEFFSGKELTVLPGRSVTINDDSAYGAILLQGHGSMNSLTVETPSLIRYGELTNDEVFVTAEAAQEGVEIVNKSDKDELVMLKHFGPGNDETSSVN